MQQVPNLLSLGRLVATALVFIFVIINTPWAFALATLFFVLASITDFLDGYFARRFHVVSPLGIFLDLTADKVFVVAILVALVQIALVPAWIVVIIVAREFVVMGMRSMAAAKGKIIPAGMWGKQKTLITMCAMGLLLLAKGLGAGGLSLFPLMVAFNSSTVTVPNVMQFVADIGIILATIWTIFSGIEYLIDGWPVLRKEEANPSKA
jgi:CDP-diacylglycerol--glycerol-3-phosphate 3-phosphatidyltransferase